MRTLLAVDPGSISGWAVVSITLNPMLLVYGNANMSKGSPTTIIIERILSNAAVPPPERCVIEDQYLDKNVDSLKKLARSAGRWEEACISSGMTVDYVPAASWQRSELSAVRQIARKERKRMSIAKVHGIWGVRASEHIADAALLARYAAIHACYESGPFRGRDTCAAVARDTT